MATRFGFGTGIAAQQWYLLGTDPAPLPSPPPGGIAPLPDSIEAVYTGADPGDLLFGGTVAVAAATPGGLPGLLFDALGSHGAVPNAQAIIGHAAALRFTGFDHVDVALSGGGDSAVEIVGAQRANVVTGGGDDLVRIDTARLGDPGWQDDYRIATGRGDDTVRIGGADIAGLLAAGDASFAGSGGAPLAFDTSGAAQRVHADLGRGNDLFLGNNATADSVRGGGGADTIWAGAGDDTLIGGNGADVFTFLPGHGHDVIRDFADDLPPRASRPFVEDFEDNKQFFDFLSAVPDGEGDFAVRADGLSITLTARKGGTFDLASLRFESLPDNDPSTTSQYVVSITAIGPDASAPASITVIEGVGATLGGVFNAQALNLLVPFTGAGGAIFIDDASGTWHPPPPPEDLLRFPTMTAAQATAMLAAAVQDGPDTLLDTGDGTIRLLGVDHTSLGLDDLILG